MAREKGMGNLQKELSGRYTARICIDGERIARSTRTKNYDKAEAYLQKMLRPYGRGERALPLAEVWNAYERSPDRREISARTIHSKKNVWFQFAEWIEKNHCEIIHLNQLTRDVLAEYLRVIRPGHSAGTYNNHICILREIYRVLSASLNILEDPWRGIRLLPSDVHTRRELTRDELAKLLDVAEKISRDWKLLFVIGIYTGLRLGDCCTLEWQSICFERNIIQVIPRKTRRHANGMPVTIPIHRDLKNSLLAITPRDEKYVLPQFATWYLGSEHWRIGYGLEEIFREARIATSVKIDGRNIATPDATFHSLRHTFVSFSANAGVPLAIVQSIVGHSSTIMTRHYYHENEEALYRAISSIPDLAMIRDSKTELSRQEDFGDFSSRFATRTISSRLEELGNLLSRNLISREEYNASRSRIIASL